MGVASVTAETERPVDVESSDVVAAAADGPLLEEGSLAGGAADAAAGERPLLEGSAGADADSGAPEKRPLFEGPAGADADSGAPEDLTLEPEDLERVAAAVAAARSGLEPAS